MDKKLYDQITSLIEKSQKILILAHARVDCDGLGAALSSYLVLKELGKEPTVVTNDPAPDNLQFLPSMDILQNSMAGSTDFIITVDSSKTAIGKIKYNVEGDKVNIIITPKDGSFSENDVSFDHGANKFDLMMVLDTGNLEHLGPIYDKNVEMFYDTPIINIDHHVSNTDFGQVNLVDSTASSTTEILYEYLSYLEKKYDKKLITENIATLLLAGIITDTGSFQHANTSPRAMETSSKLLDLGARQQEIIKNIYKTKKLSTLKLWGIILSKVQVDPVHRMVWSTISKDDLQEADADPDETEGIIDDLLTNAPGAEVIFLIKQSPEYTSVSMRSTNNQTDVGKFCADNGGGGHVRAAGFKVRSKKPFDQVISEVVSKVQKFQAGRLNIHEDTIDDPIIDPVEDPIGVKSDKPTDTANVSNDAVGIRHALSKEGRIDKAEKKETYLDFKKPRKPAGNKADKPTDTAEAKNDDAVGDAHVRPKDEQMNNKPTDEQPAREPRKRKRKRKPRKPMGDPIGAPMGDPMVVKSAKPVVQPVAPQPAPTPPTPQPPVAPPPVKQVAVDQPVVAEPTPTPPPVADVQPQAPQPPVDTPQQPPVPVPEVAPQPTPPTTPDPAPEMPDWLRAEPTSGNADKPAPDVEPV